jgi:hypothetical protein
VHNLTIGNLTVRADPSIRTASIDESDWPRAGVIGGFVLAAAALSAERGRGPRFRAGLLPGWWRFSAAQ